MSAKRLFETAATATAIWNISHSEHQRPVCHTASTQSPISRPTISRPSAQFPPSRNRPCNSRILNQLNGLCKLHFRRTTPEKPQISVHRTGSATRCAPASFVPGPVRRDSARFRRSGQRASSGKIGQIPPHSRLFHDVSAETVALLWPHQTPIHDGSPAQCRHSVAIQPPLLYPTPSTAVHHRPAFPATDFVLRPLAAGNTRSCRPIAPSPASQC